MLDSAIVIGFDLGGTKMHAAAVDAEGHVLYSERQKTRASDGADAVIDRIVGLVVRVRGDLGARAGDLSAVCIGVPGAIDSVRGVVDKAANLGWSDVPLAARLEHALGLPVFLDNDVRVAVVGEYHYGVGRGTRSLVGLFVGTGIGGGLVLDGKLHLGSRGVAGEIGHTTIVPHGPRCPCGKRGCIEALASRTAMQRRVDKLLARGSKSRVRKLMKKEKTELLTSSVVEKAFYADDDVMLKVLKEAQYYLGLGVANLVNALDPEVVVIGGGLAERLGERFVAPIREHAYKHFLVQRDRDRVHIVPTQLKDLAAPLGAAHIARQRLDTGRGKDHGASSWPVPSA